MNPVSSAGDENARAAGALSPRTPVVSEPFGTRQRLMNRTTHYGGSVLRKHQLVLALALAWGNDAPMAGGGFVPR